MNRGSERDGATSYAGTPKTAMHWKKNGSPTVKIENALDGSDGIVTATRTVDLNIAAAYKVKIENSTVKYSTEK